MNNRNFNVVTEAEEQWLTPPEIIKSLGSFALDPCSPIVRPWPTARRHYTKEDNGLALPWAGRVWLNAPYGRETSKWMKKLAEHGNGIALVFNRSETKWFHSEVWEKADAIFVFKGRLKFFKVDGTQGKSAPAPSVLVAYGKENVEALRVCGLPGHFEELHHSAAQELPVLLGQDYDIAA